MSLDIISDYNYRYNKVNNAKNKETKKNTEKSEKSDDKTTDKVLDKNNQLNEILDTTANSKWEQYKEFFDSFSDQSALPPYMDLLSTTTPDPKSCIMIDKNYLKNLNNQEAFEEYKSMLNEIAKIDKLASQWYKNSNMEVVARGWIIDKNGNVSGWSITRTKTEKKKYSYIDKEKLEKIRKEKKEKEKKREKIRKEKEEDEKHLKKLREKKEKEKKKVSKSQIKNAKRYNATKLNMISSLLNKTI